jgi:hypothetical protein
MTRVHILLTTAAAGLAGCSFTPRADSDAAPGDDDPDASGLIDAPDTDDASPGDTDLDTIPDAIDNCPTIANTAQLNEDGDDRGNACDLCPHMVGTVPGTDADGDGDGIGDQCDPRVGTDRLVVFLGFDAPEELAAFSIRAGLNMWAISGGQLHQNNDATSAQHIVWTGESITGTVIAETEAHIDSIPSPSTIGSRLVAVTGGYYDPGTPPDTYACAVRASSATATNTTVAAVHYVGPPMVGGIEVAPFGGMIAPGMTAQLKLVATQTNPNSRLDCFANGTPVALAVNGYYPEGFPGFRTLGVVASFDYMFVVAPGP